MNIYESIYNKDTTNLRKQYLNAKPYPHLIIDNFFNEDVAKNIEKTCRNSKVNVDVSDGFQQSKKIFLNDWSLMPEDLLKVCSFFNSGNFIKFLENITNLNELISDPYLIGGGLHKTERDGFLKMHTDFNWHNQLKLNRKINALYFLNSQYCSDWGGELHLSSSPENQTKSEMKKIEPLFNRLVIFNTNDNTFHGYPDPINFPKNYERTSLAFYYYSSKKRELSEISRRRSSKTRYVVSKNERFEYIKAKNLRSILGNILRRLKIN